MALRNSPSTTALVTSSSFAQPRMPPMRPNRTTNMPKTTIRLITGASGETFDLGCDARGGVRNRLAAGGRRHRRPAVRGGEQRAHGRQELGGEPGVLHQHRRAPLHEVVGVDL